MADYSKWDAMAREEEEAEKRDKENKRTANREKYYRDQEEKKIKYLQEQEAKKKASADTHNHSHSHGGGSGHGHSHGGPDDSTDGKQPLLSTIRRPACGCGYADVEEMKRAAAEAAAQPQFTTEEKNAKKLSAVHATREHGKQLFGAGQFAEAFAVYERGVLIASSIFGVSDAVQDELTGLEVTLDLNMAMCKLKMEAWKDAIDQARMALQLDATSVKAHYRMAQGYVGLGDYKEARQHLAKCTALDKPGTCKRDIAALLADIKRREANERDKVNKFTKQLEAKMAKENTFGGSAAEAAAAAAQAATPAEAAAATADSASLPAASAGAATPAADAAAATSADSDLSELTDAIRTAQLQPQDPNSWHVDGPNQQPPATHSAART